jgi:site-specific DNA recombinase
MPHLRAREASLRGQIDALNAQAADRDAYLKLADDIDGFLSRLHGSAGTASTEERQRVLRLLVKDVLIGPETITIRHRIPARGNGSAHRQDAAKTDTEGDHRPDYPLRWRGECPAMRETRYPATGANRRHARIVNSLQVARVRVYLGLLC